MGILFAILASLGIGIANFLLKKSYASLSSSIAFFLFAIFSMLIWLPIGLIMGVNWQYALVGIGIGLISAILGQASWIFVLSKGELSVTGTLLASFPIYTVIFATLFLGERMNFPTAFCVVLSILGTLIVSAPSKFHKSELKKIGFILLAIVGAAAVGTSDTFSKYLINKASLGTFFVFVSLAQLLFALVYLRIEKEKVSQFTQIISHIKKYRFALLGSLFLVIATMLMFVAFSLTLASIASPITATYPVLTIILAMIFLKEKLTVKNGIGLLLVLLAIIGISFVS